MKDAFAFPFSELSKDVFPLTTLNFDVAELPVHWEILEIHRAGRGDGQPGERIERIRFRFCFSAL